MSTTESKFELYKALNIAESEYAFLTEKLGRDPNELEVYLFSAMWSEHCGYKHSRRYLGRFPKAGSICAEENAGGVSIGDNIIFFKVESHNHPSAVEPFQGAATGIGGIIRDVLALGARPIALLDSLKFGPITNDGVKHLFDGVVKGISAYGNSIGVPTVAGEVGFDECYTTSPLVNVMAVGIAHKDEIKKSGAPVGNSVVLLGSHTGRDGIHGASFASRELTENSKEDRPSVQVGDPFVKKVVIESTLEILKLDEVLACQDCGAAGLLSSTSEMAYKGDCGMELYLDKVHLREDKMQPWEIMLSESQERMIFVVKPDSVDKVLDIAKKYDIPAVEIGKTIPEKEYRLFWYGEMAANVSPELLNNGPLYTLNEIEPDYIKEYRTKSLKEDKLTDEMIEKMVSDPNFASKKWVYRQYDHTVGDRTRIKPSQAGAAGMWIYEEGGYLGLTIDSCPRQVFLNPYEGSKCSVWEAYRNLVSSGFTPLGVTDCMNYGNPEKDEVAYQFVKSIDGIAQACKDAQIPVVSGNVSFYNECPEYRVFPTPSIGMVGYADSDSKLITNAAKAGDSVYLIGKEMHETSDVGGSLYQRVLYDFIGSEVDVVDSELEKLLVKTIFELKAKNLLSACNDVSEGGLFGALFECLRAGNTGFSGSLIKIKNHQKALFGEIWGRYVITTVDEKETEAYLKANNVPYSHLGICGGDKIEFDDYSYEAQRLFDLYDKTIESEIER